MRGRRIIAAAFFTAVFVCALIYFGKTETPPEIEKEQALPFSDMEVSDLHFELTTDSGRVRIDLWENPSWEWTLFLPSFAKNGTLACSYDDSICDIFFDDVRVRPGYEITIDNLPERIGVRYLITGRTDIFEHRLKTMVSENIPALFITTQTKDKDELDSDKQISDRGAFNAVNFDGTVDCSGGLEMIRARGNSSFQASKKSYRLKLSQKTALFGMSPEKSFILQANAYDNTNIRNTLAYTMAADMDMPFTPKFTPVDLYINDSYVGSYLLLESVKTGAGRVDISGNDSYLFEVVHDERRLEEDHFSFMLGGEIHLQVLYPEEPDEAQKQYAVSHMNRLENMIWDASEGDELSELSGYLELGSFADMFLYNFITNDLDAGNYSSYAYLDGDDHLVHLGPVWDYDKAWGNEKKRNELYEFNSYSWRWPEILYDNSEYFSMLRAKYPEVEEEVSAMLDTGIKEMAEETEASFEMDMARNDVMAGQSVNTGSRKGDIEQMSEYLRNRCELLKAVLFAPDEYCRVFIKGRSGRLFWVKKGESLTDEELSFAGAQYGCDSFSFSDGRTVTSDDVINEDCVVTPK